MPFTPGHGGGNGLANEVGDGGVLEVREAKNPREVCSRIQDHRLEKGRAGSEAEGARERNLEFGVPRERGGGK